MPENLGGRIKKLREKAGITQKKLAERLHISNTTLSQYESGQRIPSDEIKLKIADYFDVSLDFLFGNSKMYQKEKVPLSEKKGNLIVQRALKDTGLLNQDGNLSEKGGKIISEFIFNNANMLKKLINKDK